MEAVGNPMKGVDKATLYRAAVPSLVLAIITGGIIYAAINTDVVAQTESAELPSVQISIKRVDCATTDEGHILQPPAPTPAALPTLIDTPWHQRRDVKEVIWCESRYDHEAIGDEGEAKGLFQVHGRIWGAVPDDPEGQADQAGDGG